MGEGGIGIILFLFVFRFSAYSRSIGTTAGRFFSRWGIASVGILKMRRVVFMSPGKTLMQDDIIEIKSDRELDALIAEKIMGLPKELISTNGSITYEGRSVREIDYYSTDIGAAFEVLNRFHHWEIKKYDDGLIEAWVFEQDKEQGIFLSYWDKAYTVPLAICLAALKTIGQIAYATWNAGDERWRLMKTINISGIGERYELTCQKMLKQGIVFMEAHPEKKYKFTCYKNIYGVINATDDASRELEKAILEGNDYVTGAMVQSVILHLMFIHVHGYEAWIADGEKHGRVFEFDGTLNSIPKNPEYEATLKRGKEFLDKLNKEYSKKP